MNRPAFARLFFWLALGLFIGCVGLSMTCLRGGSESESASTSGSTPSSSVWPKDAGRSDQAVPFAKHLAGMRICLDPGHGGDANRPNYKRGPTGLREAEVNLRVALVLREMLRANGAIVFMTRENDRALADDNAEDLQRRAEVANRNNCDLFLSIHHNASDRPTANFVSVWYHDDVDHSPASLDVAREVSAALMAELRLPDQLGVPILSDKLIYDSGFRVLQQARVPAILTEASFHSNLEEEERLRDPEYNRREARAIFTGLAHYALGGVPRIRLISPANGRVSASSASQVVIELDDGLRSRKSWSWERRMILRDSIIVRVGNEPWPFNYDEKTDRVTLSLPSDCKPGVLELNVQFENMFKHSNTQPRLTLQVGR